MAAFAFNLSDTTAQRFNMLVGTYTTGKSEGIYVYEFDANSGDFKLLNKATGVENPSFLAVSRDKTNIYAVNEAGQDNGGVSAFSYDNKTGSLRLLNRVNSGGDHPCYIAVDELKAHVFAANYSGGNLSAMPVKPDGSLGDAVQTIQHRGSGPNKARQEKAHVHMTTLSPDGKFLLVNDLGTDKITTYRYNRDQEKPLSEYASVSVKPGSGPRHLTFHPSNKLIFLLHELTGDITTLTYLDGKISPVATTSHLGGFDGKIDAADIHTSPDGKFLYASYRGDLNEIAIYSIEEKSGRLTFVGKQSTLGIAPRNFAIDPTGKYLVAANQKSDSIVLFSRNEETGLLQPTGKQLEVENPVCLLFVPRD